jgi:hypothetical protein
MVAQTIQLQFCMLKSKHASRRGKPNATVFPDYTVLTMFFFFFSFCNNAYLLSDSSASNLAYSPIQHPAVHDYCKFSLLLIYIYIYIDIENNRSDNLES